MSVCHKRYIAGLIDGRANISLDKSNTNYRVYIKFMSNRLSFLASVDESLRELGFVGRLVLGSFTKGHQQYVLYYNVTQTIDLLTLIRDSLKYKQDLADFVLKFHREYNKYGTKHTKLDKNIRYEKYCQYKLLKKSKRSPVYV